MPGAAHDIAVNKNGDLWVIGVNKEGSGFGIYQWIGRWKKISGSAVRIAVSPNGPWVVNKQGSIFQLQSGRWRSKTGCAKDIGAGHNGDIYVVGCSREKKGWSIFKWNGSNGWKRIPGSATNISVDRCDRPVITDSSGAVSQSYFSWNKACSGVR